MTETHAPLPDGEDADLYFHRLTSFEAETVSPQIIARTRKNHAIILQKLNDLGGGWVARIMGVHDSSISRWKSQGALMFACRLLAILGLKIVPESAIVYIEPEEYQ